MSGPGAVDEVVRRLEANLKAARRLETPLGAVELGEQVYVRRNVGDAALQATLEARKGIVLRSSMQIALELAALDQGDAERLKALVAKHEAKLRNRLDLHAVLAVYAASGWDEEAVRYARNDPPGTGYAHRGLHLVLVGPGATELVMGAHDELALSLRAVLRGRTDEEDDAIAREALRKALALDGYAVLERVARDAGLDGRVVERSARELASTDSGLRMETVSGAGMVLRRKG